MYHGSEDNMDKNVKSMCDGLIKPADEYKKIADKASKENDNQFIISMVTVISKAIDKAAKKGSNKVIVSFESDRIASYISNSPNKLEFNWRDYHKLEENFFEKVFGEKGYKVESSGSYPRSKPQIQYTISW